jgi:hypothetical protein
MHTYMNVYLDIPAKTDAFHMLVHLPPGICMHLFVSIHKYVNAYIYECVFGK